VRGTLVGEGKHQEKGKTVVISEKTTTEEEEGKRLQRKKGGKVLENTHTLPRSESRGIEECKWGGNR